MAVVAVEQLQVWQKQHGQLIAEHHELGLGLLQLPPSSLAQVVGGQHGPSKPSIRQVPVQEPLCDYSLLKCRRQLLCIVRISCLYMGS